MSDNENQYSGDWIWVKAGKNSQGNRVAIYEENEMHPDGQAFVYGDRVRQVYPTDEVVMRMREGFLDEERNYKPEEAEKTTDTSDEPNTTTMVATDAQPQFNDGGRETAAQRKARERRESEENNN